MAQPLKTSFFYNRLPLLKGVIFALILFYSPEYITAQNVDEQTASELSKKGKEEFLLGNYPKAIEFYNEALKLNSGLKEVNYQAGLAKYNLKNYNEAITYFTAEIKNNTQNLNAYLYRGISKSKIGENFSALKDLDKANALDKNNALVYLEKANILFANKEYKKAIAEYSIATSLNSSLELAYYKTGWCYRYLKNTTSACLNWRKIADLDDFEGYEKAEKILNENKNIK
jgi:tetratricopeptide (TPR) repeat protein